MSARMKEMFCLEVKRMDKTKKKYITDMKLGDAREEDAEH